MSFFKFQKQRVLVVNSLLTDVYTFTSLMSPKVEPGIRSLVFHKFCPFFASTFL